MRQFSFFAILIAALVPAVPPASAAETRQRVCPMAGIQQLRIYEIYDGNKAALHARFRDHAMRIMKRHGFDIVAMWETRHGDRTELAYLLQWPDEAALNTGWAGFMADEEWARIKRETGAVHGKTVGEIQDRTLRRTEYSPC
jgi:hypothetical protein